MITDALYMVKFKVGHNAIQYVLLSATLHLYGSCFLSGYYRAVSQISKVSTPSASYPAASSTGPTSGH